jgi:hypothetical protein
MTATSLLVWTGVVIVAYLVICNRTIALMHPIRMRMVALGEHLLDQRDLPTDDAQNIRTCLDHAYSKAAAWAFACLMPYAILGTIKDIIKEKFLGIPDQEVDRVPAHLRDDVGTFCVLSFFSMSMSSPLAGLFIGVQLLCAALVWLPIHAIIFEVAKVAVHLEKTTSHLARLPVGRHTA